MEQKDYLMKQINELGRVLGKILADLFRLKAQGKVSDSVQFVNQSLKQKIVLGLDELLEIPMNEMLTLLQTEKNFNDENLESLAELMSETAEIHDPKSDQKLSNRLNLRSLEILEFLNEHSGSFSITRENQIRKIKNRMKNT